MTSITSYVRGGGFGRDAWVARIVGADARFGLAREFVEKHENISGSGRSGSVRFDISAPGIYEYRGVQHPSGRATIGTLDRGFVVVLHGQAAWSDCTHFARMPSRQEMFDAGFSAHEIIKLGAWVPETVG